MSMRERHTFLEEKINALLEEYTPGQILDAMLYVFRNSSSIRGGAPEKIWCFHHSKDVHIISGKCVEWRQGCRACMFGYEE